MTLQNGDKKIVQDCMAMVVHVNSVYASSTGEIIECGVKKVAAGLGTIQEGRQEVERIYSSILKVETRDFSEQGPENLLAPSYEAECKALLEKLCG
jgi:hypothetical protein